MTNQIANDLPEYCYVVTAAHPGRRIGMVRLNESGYYPTSLDDPYDTEEQVQARVTALNERSGVTPGQAERMQTGSMFGWDTPGARMTASEFLARRNAMAEGA